MPFWAKIKGKKSTKTAKDNDDELDLSEIARELSMIKLKQYPKYRLHGKFLAQVVKVYDGDTITIVLRTGDDQPYFEYSVRMFGYDSPEIKPPLAKDYSDSRFPNRDAEIAAGKEARDYLSNIILNMPVLVEVIPDNDKYGRLLCNIFVFDGIRDWLGNKSIDPLTEYHFTLNINEDMIANGHGYEYDGGTKKK